MKVWLCHEHRVTVVQPFAQHQVEVQPLAVIPHALAVHGSGGQVRTAAIAPDGTAKLTVDLGTAGSYQWFCPLDGHRARGMRGTIVVGA